MVRFWEFFLYSGYKFFIRYKVCKHFLPVCSLFFHFLSCWSLNLSYIPPYYSQLQECLIISKPHINSWNDLIYFRPLLSGMQMLQAQGACLFSVQFNHSVVSDSLRPHESQHTRPSCPSPTPRVHSNSCPSSRWCHPAISSSVIPFSACPQSLPASGSFPMSQLFTWGG